MILTTKEKNKVRCRFYSNNLHIGQFILRDHDNDGCTLWSFEIFESFRSQGFGKQMLKECIDLVRKMGYKCIGLSVFCDNKIAYSLYKSCGFRKGLKLFSEKHQNDYYTMVMIL